MPAPEPAAQVSPPPPPARERLSLDEGWRFRLGEIPMPVVKGHGMTYANAKAGRAWGAADPEFDDTGWRVLNLPHDWVVEGPFDPDANLSQGYRPRGFAWYRRHFLLPAADRGRHLELQFDGIATHATVWINGNLVHRNWCGYTSSYLDVTPLLHFGERVNTIAVRVDAQAQEGWWYEGGGIYRHVWLVKRNAIHLQTDGVFAQPVRHATEGTWTIPVEAALANSGRVPGTVDVESTLFAPDGRRLASATASIGVEPLDHATARFTLPISFSPELWSVESPTLYRIETTVGGAGHQLDLAHTTVGFRTLRFDAQKGFFLNDRPLKLKGVCNHQDHAGVGVAVPDALWNLRLCQLKSLGVNAYRCAHHPPATEFLDACDRLGVLVMDENRHFNASPEYLAQLQWLIRRDRNHPSVILWSVFNEEPAQGTEIGLEMVRRMVATVKRLDTTRPVTAAMNGGLFNAINVSQGVDVVGFNYQIDSYDRFHAANPGLPLTSSEDTSAFMTRGEYQTDPARRVIGSYDDQPAVWGATHRAAWQAIAERPWLAGGFLWTGHDYRGEPTPHEWPAVSSFFGALDVCGFPKAAAYMHQAHWLDQPVLQLIPHWNWSEIGSPIKVMAITNAERVRLTLNGRLVGEAAVDRFMFVAWDVPYEPGQLEAVGWRGGVEIARHLVETTGEPTTLRLVPNRLSLDGDGRDALAVTIEARDAAGRLVPTSKLPVQFELTGPGTILGHGNGDPTSHEPEKGDHRRLFNGLAQVILQSTRAAGGDPRGDALTLRAHADGLASAEVVVTVVPVPARPAVPAAEPGFNVRGWFMSPGCATRPAHDLPRNENDQNSWVWHEPGYPIQLTSGTFAVARTDTTPPKNLRRHGCRLTFECMVGRAEVWVDGQVVGRKETFEPAPLTVDLAPSEQPRRLELLLEAGDGQPVGLGGQVMMVSGARCAALAPM